MSGTGGEGGSGYATIASPTVEPNEDQLTAEDRRAADEERAAEAQAAADDRLAAGDQLPELGDPSPPLDDEEARDPNAEPCDEIAPMYKRLPHGPHGLAREQVARNQRARLYGGMVESVYQRGYAATSVAHVIGLAGVSRRAFYEQFSNKEDCFLATYDALVAGTRKRVLKAWVAERGWANRLHHACRVFLEGIAMDPRGAYLVLVESVATGPRGYERMQATATSFERVVATGFALSPDRIPLPPLAPRSIVGGARFVVVRRLREGRAAELVAVTDELLDWISSYRATVVNRLRALGSSRPPRLVARRARFLTREDRRSTVMDAMVQLALEEGYANVSDADVARAATISTEAFHREFSSKQECLLAIVDEFAAEAHDAVLRATRNDDDWGIAVYKGVEALVGYCAAHPGLVRLSFIDLFEAGDGMVHRVSGLLDGFINVMVKRIPNPERAPKVAAEAIVGAAWGILSSYAPHERLRYLPCLVDHLAFLILAPYIGARNAVELIEAESLERRQLAAS
ncbi:MAG TPA: TetR/AcrR family transcriptional regulator [Solirubrobacteraceae bacterium]|nr:TetR/AcrR family transcriptional regulator [Solirubrobacteraceae bacterium]